jgi:glutaconate CoA-transferase subunit B
VVDATGWPVRFADDVDETPPPTRTELDTLRELQRRTDIAHGSAG